MVITVEIYKEIRRLRLSGLSQRKIADKLGISRNTVKKYWDGEKVPWERKPYSRTANVMTEDVKDFILKCLREDEACRSKKQHHTSRRIYDRLTAEYGFTGSESSVRRLVKELRTKLPEAYVPLVFPVGDAMQIDWGEATVYLNGEKTVVNLFCARLCYSDTPFVRAYRRQNEKVFWKQLCALWNISEVYRDVSSLITPKLPSRTDSVLMQKNRQDIPHCRHTTDLTPYSAIPPPGMRRDWWKVLSDTSAAIPAYRFRE